MSHRAVILFLVAAAGSFGRGWGEMADAMGLRADILNFPEDGPVDPQGIEDALRRDTEGKIKAVLVCQVDTSTGGKSDIAAIRSALDAGGS